MVRAGSVLVNVVTGFRLRFVRTAADTGGTLLEVEATYPPGGPAPPLHLHPEQEERFEALRGSVRVRLGGEERELREGETLRIPPRVPHAMWNAGTAAATLRWETRPALRTEDLFERLMTLAALGRVDRHGTPGLLDLAILFPAHRREMRIARPPYVVQRALFGLLAPLACALGRDRLPAAEETSAGRSATFGPGLGAAVSGTREPDLRTAAGGR